MNINQIEPKFEEHDERLETHHEQLNAVCKRVEQLEARLQEHEEKTVYAAHVREVDEGEPTGDEAVFKAAAAAADAADAPLQEAIDAVQKTETPTDISEEAVETVVNGHASPAEAIFEQAEEVVEKVATEVDDATFPEPEKVESVATVEVVVSGDLDPATAALLEQLKDVDNELVKVTVERNINVP